VSDESETDPFTMLHLSDEPIDPRPRFAADLKQRLEEAVMQDQATPQPPATVANLFYFNLPAPDLERSKVFWSKVLGWEVQGGSLGGHVANTNTPCGLHPGADPEDRLVYLTTFDMDASLELVRSLGGTVMSTDAYETGRAATCRDDQGTLFALQEPSDAYREHANNPTVGSAHGDLFYFALPVADGDKGRAFYGRLFGWTFGEEGTQGGNHAENMVTDGGLGAGRDGDRVDFWFRVDSVADAIAAVRSAGGTASDPIDTPQGLMSNCTDDQGVSFGLAEPAAGY